MLHAKQYLQGSERLSRPPRSRAVDPGFRVTQESIQQYLSACRNGGHVEGTLQTYHRGLRKLYEDLPADKVVRYGTLERWREELLQGGYAPSTVNGFLSVSNAYLDFMGHREYQAVGQLRQKGEPVPELSRNEYLRLLQTARILGKEKVYLLVKLFGSTGLTVQELEKVTVEAVEAGRVAVVFSKIKSIVRIPAALQKELLSYARRHGRFSGPIFVTKEGTPIGRSYVTYTIRSLCAEAKIAEEKGNPRCLRKLYMATREGIESNISLLVEQALERQLEQEQLRIGWEE